MGHVKTVNVWRCDNCGKEEAWGPNWRTKLILHKSGGPGPEGCEVLHLNHNPADNRLENLRYGTRGENLRMDYQAGRRTVPQNFIGARWRA